ncbi:hypothetical protein ABZ318_28625 [Streptomyces sp. NPDC006197]|uniref:hypothetical protein n=1 Tax=Streptomyces sp. NPDC006197 TaxID=3156685 RepID=UPI0033AD3025
MFVEIVLVGLPTDRDEVEEALDTAFGPDGEITGAGRRTVPVRAPGQRLTMTC